MSLSLIICPVEPALLLTRCSDLLFGYGSKAVAVVEVLIQVDQSSPLCVPSSGTSPQSDLARPQQGLRSESSTGLLGAKADSAMLSP
jgi:hypothetical protein